MSDLDKRLEELKNVATPVGLDERIIGAVRREARRRRVIFSLLEAGLAAAVAASFLSVRLFLADLSASPLGQLLKLAWTDSRELLGFFSDWLLAVMESTPFGSLSLALGMVFLSAFLLDRLARFSGFKIRQTKKAV